MAEFFGVGSLADALLTVSTNTTAISANAVAPDSIVLVVLSLFTVSSVAKVTFTGNNAGPDCLFHLILSEVIGARKTVLRLIQ